MSNDERMTKHQPCTPPSLTRLSPRQGYVFLARLRRSIVSDSLGQCPRISWPRFSAWFAWRCLSWSDAPAGLTNEIASSALSEREGRGDPTVCSQFSFTGVLRGSPVHQRSAIPSVWLKHFLGSLAEKLQENSACQGC